MAFVFRSDKVSVFQPKKQQQQLNQGSTLSNQQSKLNGTSYSNSPRQNQSQKKIMKGLPSLLGKKQKFNNQKSFQKENNIIYPELRSNKNLENSKKSKLNYYFSSKVLRDPYQLAFQQKNANLLDSLNETKSKTSYPFQKLQNSMTSYSHQKNRFYQKVQKTTNKQNVSQRPINKNLKEVGNITGFQFKKASISNELKDEELNKIKVDCIKQPNQNQAIKRKSSPPKNVLKKSIQIDNSLISHKSNQDKPFHFPQKQPQIYMKGSQESKNIILKKNLQDRKLSKLKKGALQTSFYKQLDQQENSQQSQYEDTPGPGSYQNDINLKQKKSFRSRKQKFAKIFMSPIQRFKNQTVKFHQVTYVNQVQPNRPKIANQMFLSKSPKLGYQQKKNDFPAPGSYNVRQSMEHSIVSNLLRNANVPNFCSSLPRFLYPSIQSIPGPGSYNIDILQKIRSEQVASNMSSSYKSKVKRCIDPMFINNDTIKQDYIRKSELQLISKQKQQINLIHKRQQFFDSSQFFTAPPFLSGVQRFTQISDKDKQNDRSIIKITKRPEKKEAVYLNPFNSTQKRKMCDIVGSGIGVGSYFVQKDSWNKKSYNIFFH